MAEAFPQQEVELNVPDFEIEEAQEVIRNLIERGEYPVVTIPARYKEELSHGLSPHSTWIPEQQLICGTLGRKPYFPHEEERIAVTVEISPDQIEPRATGPDHHWHGIVVLHGPIPPEALHF
jgi:hypothetical protein